MHTLQRGLHELARLDPPSAVFEGYQRVDRELRKLMRGYGRVYFDDTMSAAEVAELARQYGVIKEEAADAIDGLTVLRNLAAHGGAEGLSTERALEYVDLVVAVLHALRQRPEGEASDQ
jgi:hypothetical protein